MIGTLGKITVPAAGTPVSAVAGSNYENKPQPCHGIMVQTAPGNTGNIYVGTADMDKSTLAGVFAVLPIPTDNFLPTFSAALTIAPNALKLNEFYIDADVNDDGAIVSYLIL